eukprot:NODE_816_length_3944_cov_0.511573.p4 type:complete len:159 gc:universal NODE_816_length_3944_cov_0.511573:173-649(+)
MSNAAILRLQKERKNFRKERPFGFSAVPQKSPNGELNLLSWTCKIPGKKDTDWADGIYTVNLLFSKSYPLTPPVAIFTPPLFHVNIFSEGKVCLSLLKESGDWKASISLKTILLNLQDFLANPNIKDPANGEATRVFKQNRARYDQLIRQQAKKFAFE